MTYNIEKQSNGKYKVRVWSKLDIFGKKKSEQKSNISGITAATKWAKERELILNDCIYQDTKPIDSDILFSKLEQLYFDERKDKVSPTTLCSTFKYNRVVALEYLGEIKARQINTFIIQQFIDEKQKLGLKRKTVENYVSYITTVLNWGVNHDFLEFNRIKKLNYIDDDEEFEATTLTIDQAVDLLIAMKKECYNIYIPSLISILTGARRGEVLGLKWEYVNFENKILEFKKNLISVDGKPLERNKLKTKKSSRENPMADFLKEELLEHKEKFANPFSDQVCSNIFVGDISPDYLTHMVHDFIFEKFNINMREHDLRHTFSQLIEDNEDILIAKSEMMGHSNLFTTKYFYTKPSFVRKARVSNILGELIREKMCAKMCAKI